MNVCLSECCLDKGCQTTKLEHKWPCRGHYELELYKIVQFSTRRSFKLYVKYKETDALSLWHQQQSTTVDIHGPLQTRGETRCPGGVSVFSLASRTRYECPRHNDSVYMESCNWMWTDTI